MQAHTCNLTAREEPWGLLISLTHQIEEHQDNEMVSPQSKVDCGPEEQS